MFLEGNFESGVGLEGEVERLRGLEGALAGDLERLGGGFVGVERAMQRARRTATADAMYLVRRKPTLVD